MIFPLTARRPDQAFLSHARRALKHRGLDTNTAEGPEWEVSDGSWYFRNQRYPSYAEAREAAIETLADRIGAS